MNPESTPGELAELFDRARRAPQRVVLPGAEEETILRAARAAVDLGLAQSVLLGSPAAVAAEADRAGVDLSGVEALDVTREAVRAELARTASRLFPSVSTKRIEHRLQDRLSTASLLVAAGRADAFGPPFLGVIAMASVHAHQLKLGAAGGPSTAGTAAAIADRGRDAAPPHGGASS